MTGRTLIYVPTMETVELLGQGDVVHMRRVRFLEGHMRGTEMEVHGIHLSEMPEDGHCGAYDGFR